MNTLDRPAGFILKETLMAVALAAALAVGAAEFLTTIAQQRRWTSQYAVAVQEMGNLMEDFMSRPWADTSAERLTTVRLSDACRQHLPGARLQVSVTDEDDVTRRISIAMDWLRPSGQRGDPVRLVGWKVRDEESSR